MGYIASYDIGSGALLEVLGDYDQFYQAEYANATHESEYHPKNGGSVPYPSRDFCYDLPYNV